MPLVKITARGVRQEDVRDVFEKVLAHIQAKNSNRVQSQIANTGALIASIDERITDIQHTTLPYLESKIRSFKEDYLELKKRINQNPAVLDSLVQLQVLIDNTENTKNTLQNQTLLELDVQKAKYALMLAEGSIKNADFVASSIAPKPSFGVKIWIVLVLGLFCGAILGVLIVSFRELYCEFKRYKRLEFTSVNNATQSH
ncbi:hypothetical protein [uncultured Helicobacter sp.]|uniref:hypothetical protein n=1 Tax=uncultured Helicobacter sp. TaxID=175537 RepID=UPI00374E25AC